MGFRLGFFVTLAALLGIGGATYYWWGGRKQPAPSFATLLTFEQLTNTFFTPEPADAFKPPVVRFVRMPALAGDAADNHAVQHVNDRNDAGRG